MFAGINFSRNRKALQVLYFTCIFNLLIVLLVILLYLMERSIPAEFQESETDFMAAKRRLFEEDRAGNMSRACSRKYGADLIQNWQKGRITVCSGFSGAEIRCHVNPEYKNIPRLFCIAENVKVSLESSYYVNETVGGETIFSRTDGRPQRPLLTVDCSLRVHRWLPSSLWQGPSALFMENIRRVRVVKCQRTVNHIVLWLHRYDFRNVYHISEDLVTTFQTFLVLGDTDPADVELVIFDSFPITSTLFKLWSKWFGKGVRLISQNPFERGTCFKRSIFNMWGADSLLSHAVSK
jgi:hypothetical protein